MSIFSKFSVWDREVEVFIAKLNDLLPIQQEDLREWFHGQGALLFTQYQQVFYADFLRKTPQMLCTPEFMKNQKEYGFQRLFTDLLRKLDVKEELQRNNIGKIYQEIVLTAVANLNPNFYTVQALITNEIIDERKMNPAITLGQIFELTVNKFKQAKQCSPSLAGLIDDQLSFMLEYQAHTERMKPGVTAQAYIVARASFLNQAAPKIEEKPANNTGPRP